MGEVKVWSHNVSLTFYRLTSLSFHVNPPSHSWDTTFSKFDLENPRSRSWKRWTLIVTTWAQHSSDSHPFRSMSIGHPIHKIRLFQKLILKIRGQGHGWGQSLKSQHGSNILSTQIPFVPCQSAIPFLSYNFFKIWPWKSKVKVLDEVKVECHKVVVTSYRHIPFVPCHSALPFLRYSIFKIWLWKSKVKVMGWGGHWKSQHGSNILSL